MDCISKIVGIAGLSVFSRYLLKRRLNVRFAPKASKLLRCREMSRRAKRSTLHCKKNSDLCRRQTIADTTADPESSKVETVTSGILREMTLRSA
jgi:hypothetical protein